MMTIYWPLIAWYVSRSTVLDAFLAFDSFNRFVDLTKHSEMIITL